MSRGVGVSDVDGAPAGTRRCGRCGEVRPDDDFAWRDAAHTRPQSYCSACQRTAWREWYAKPGNAAHHRHGAKVRRRERIAQLKAAVREAKAVPCSDCGRSFPAEAMDLDHVSGTKLGELSRLVHTAGRDVVHAEIAKCEPVCATCHRIRTARRGGRGG